MLKAAIKYVFNGSMIAWYLVASCLSALLSLSIPLCTGEIVNELAKDQVVISQLITLCVCIGLLGALRAGISYFIARMYVNLQAHAGYRLNADILEHVKHLPQTFFEHFDATYYSQRINHDSNSFVIFVLTTVSNYAMNIVSIVVIVVVLCSLNMLLGMLCLILGVSGSLLYVLFKNKIYGNKYVLQEEQAKFFSALQAQLENVKTIRQHALFDRFRRMLDDSFERLYPAIAEYQNSSALFSLANSFVIAIAQVGLFVFGIFEVVNNRLEPGYLFTITSYYSNISSAFLFLLTWGRTLQENKVSFNRIRQIMEMPVENNGDIQLKHIDSIKINRLSFSYSGMARPLISDLCCEFARGKIYGVIGPNGSGKTTLLDLICGIYTTGDPGSVRINGVDMNEVDRYALRFEQIGCTEQEPTIISGSLLDNLTLLCRFPSQYDEMKADLGFLIDSLRGELSTVQNRKREGLSGGEKQKIAIIRQFLKNPDVMLFDELTSALDEQSCEVFMRALLEKKSSHLIILVTHDWRLLSICDEVIDMATSVID